MTNPYYRRQASLTSHRVSQQVKVRKSSFLVILQTITLGLIPAASAWMPVYISMTCITLRFSQMCINSQTSTQPWCAVAHAFLHYDSGSNMLCIHVNCRKDDGDLENKDFSVFYSNNYWFMHIFMEVMMTCLTLWCFRGEKKLMCEDINMVKWHHTTKQYYK